MLPQVTFVIPCYNERDYVTRCLASIAAQTADPGRFEILVVDNGSRDDTREVAAALGATVLVNRRRGAAASRNLGAAAARAPLVAFVDADCLLPPAWVATLAAHLSRADVAAAAAPAVPVTEGMTWVEKGWAAVFVSFARSSERGVAQVSNLASSNMLVRKEAFDAVGGFDESLLSCEDYDLSQRLREHGALLFDQNVEVLHLRESKTVGELFRREVARGRFSVRCFVKNGWRLRELPSTAIPICNLLAALALVGAAVAGRTQAALGAALVLAAVPYIFLARSRGRVPGLLNSLQHYAVAATYVTARSVAFMKEVVDLSLPKGTGL